MNTPLSKTVPPKIAIMGGSVAGLYTASLLARRGASVSVYEQAEQERPDCRSLIVTDRYRDLLGPLADEATVNEISRFELFADGCAATVTLDKPDVIIHRAKLLGALEQRAVRDGAVLNRGQRFVHMEARGNGLAFTVERTDKQVDEASADTIVGADGAFSRVAKAGGWDPQPTVPLIQAVVRLPSDLAADTTRIWFRPEDTPYFYWLIPDSPTQGVLGLIGEQGRDARQALERFLESQGLEPLEFQAAKIPAYTRWTPIRRRIGNAHAYLVGDAAGQVKVSTVGGVVNGLQGATGVAEAILNGGSSSALRSLRRELNLHLLVRKAIHRFTTNDYVNLITSLNPGVKKVLSTVHRDDPVKLIRRVLLRRPHLMLMGLRGVLTSRSFLDPR